jgi:S-adenosylmethionine synthetase
MIHARKINLDQSVFEVVERKGIGHPDTLADGLAEYISNSYSKYCLKEFGAVLHHNIDKTTILGGLTDLDFGKGEVKDKIRVIINGRMSKSFGGRKIDIQSIQQVAVKEYLESVLPHLDFDNWVEVITMTTDYSHNPKWYSPETLFDLPELRKPLANDTVTVVSYFPLSFTENLTLLVEGFFYIDNQPKYTFVGQDIKVMAVRRENLVDLTVCIPFISTLIENKQVYLNNIETIKNELYSYINSINIDNYIVNIRVNGYDDSECESAYLLLTGSCIEGGEEGVVGRGNKSNGIISSFSPYTMEAPCGKNPVYHVGKLYSVVADAISKSLYEKYNCKVIVSINTHIGAYLNNPNSIFVQLDTDFVEKDIKDIVNSHLNMKEWTHKIIYDGLLVPKISKV